MEDKVIIFLVGKFWIPRSITFPIFKLRCKYNEIFFAVVSANEGEQIMAYHMYDNDTDRWIIYTQSSIYTWIPTSFILTKTDAEKNVDNDVDFRNHSPSYITNKQFENPIDWFLINPKFRSTFA